MRYRGWGLLMAVLFWVLIPAPGQAQYRHFQRGPSIHRSFPYRHGGYGRRDFRPYAYGRYRSGYFHSSPYSFFGSRFGYPSSPFDSPFSWRFPGPYRYLPPAYSVYPPPFLSPYSSQDYGEGFRSLVHIHFETATSIELGFQYLEEGREAKAKEEFTVAKRQYPGDPLPKIGYGLAAGLTGDYSMAEYCFRRAFAYAFEPVFLPEEVNLDAELDQLIAEYRGQSNPTSNSRFMIAALSYLRGDDAAAHRAVRDALLRDKDSSIEKLQRMIPPIIADLPSVE